MDPTIPTTPTPAPKPTPTPTPIPTPSLETVPSPMLGSESMFEGGAAVVDRSSAVQPNIPTAPVQPVAQPTPTQSMPNMAPATPTIAANEPFVERDPLPDPDPVAEELKAPMKAAAPVPGSIGSAISVPSKEKIGSTIPEQQVEISKEAANFQAVVQPITQESQPQATLQPTPSPIPNVEPQAPTVQPAAPAAPVVQAIPAAEIPVSAAPIGVTNKEKSNKGLIVLIIMTALIIIALGVILAMQLLNGQSNTAKDDQAQSSDTEQDKDDAAAENTTSILSCKRYMDSEELLELGNATTGTEYLVANYENDVLTDISLKVAMEYEDAAQASAGMSKLRTNYTSEFKTAGFDTDPFTSEYNNDETLVNVSHTTTRQNLTEDNMTIFHLSLNQKGAIDSSFSSVQATYTSLGMDCGEVEQ